MKQANLLYHIVSIIRKALLFFTFFLIINGLGIYSEDGARALFMYSNLTSFSFWVLFLMGSILLIFIGRVFCAICPIGEFNYLFSKIGLKRKLNINLNLFQSVILFIIFFLVISFNMSRHPHYTSLIIIGAVLAAIIFGLIFKGNSFCMTICPANAFLRFYGIFSALKVTCKSKDFSFSECPVFLNPCDVKKKDCHLCLRCFKNSEGLTLKLENPFKNITLPQFSFNDLICFSILSGISFMAFIRVVREIREIFVFIPVKINEFLDLPGSFILSKTIFFGVFVYPTLFFFLTAFILKLFAGRPFMQILNKYTPFFIFSTFSVHLILAMVKINSRLSFLPYALFEPSGKDVVALRMSYSFDIPGDIIPINYLRVILLIVPIIFYLAGFYKILREEKKIALPLFLIFTSLFVFIEKIIIMWLFRGI